MKLEFQDATASALINPITRLWDMDLFSDALSPIEVKQVKKITLSHREAKDVFIGHRCNRVFILSSPATSFLRLNHAAKPHKLKLQLITRSRHGNRSRSYLCRAKSKTSYGEHLIMHCQLSLISQKCIDPLGKLIN